ncbi:hypothetical protein Egran_01741 [Elaphomyces granulatus]|uniref:DUF6594 domain-containing protein n=1 Tax=Elaphomyces granulatus TaxID=519963 RepID=A0A232M2C0_9EURO|nr:hypothetical protein Egran_01741 [Elaphomyces granulatus]
MDRITSILHSWSRQGGVTNAGPGLQAPDPDRDVSSSPIENYPSGYPQYSALISSYDFFFAFRSFRRLRSRVLLMKQDELNVLEARLDHLDREEGRPFFLGTCRHDVDGNSNRNDLLNQIHLKLSEYDASVDRCRQMLSCSRANARDIASLQNWLERTGCVNEDEISYLDRENELVSLASSSDLAMKQLEDWIEDRLIRYDKGFRTVQ